MFEDIDLITCDEDKELHMKQTQLIEEYNNAPSNELLLRIAILFTLAPVCDEITAIRILNLEDCNQFDYLIIGAYLVANSRCSVDNNFIDKLLENYINYTDKQKSIVQYLIGLHKYNNSIDSNNELLCILDESISLCGDFVSNYFLRYLISNNSCDAIKAQGNIQKILTIEEINQLSIDDFINPKRYIDEHILMNVLTHSIIE